MSRKFSLTLRELKASWLHRESNRIAATIMILHPTGIVMSTSKTSFPWGPPAGRIAFSSTSESTHIDGSVIVQRTSLPPVRRRQTIQLQL